ncbi:unnamed protein product, partial [Ixodes hexagonus]
MSSHVKREAGYRPSDPEWEAKEELRLRELEEARARAAQMEKTMRWWSDCTANWREKWSKVRTERNKAREDVRLLRGRVDAATKEAAALKRDKQELEAEVDQLRRELDYLSSCLGELHKQGGLRPVQTFAFDCAASTCDEMQLRVALAVSQWGADPLHDAAQRCALFSPFTPPTSRIADGPPSVDHEVLLSSTASSAIHAESEHLEKLLDPEATNGLQRDPEQTEQRAPLLQLRLDEAAKLLLAERQEKNQLAKTLEKQATELGQLKAKYDELRKSRQDTLKELSQVRAEHQDELECIRIDLEDEASGRTCLDKRLTELRAQGTHVLCGPNAPLVCCRLRIAREWKEGNHRSSPGFVVSSSSLPFPALTPIIWRERRKTRATIKGRRQDEKDRDSRFTRVSLVRRQASLQACAAQRRVALTSANVSLLNTRLRERLNSPRTFIWQVDSATNNIRKLQRCNDELQEQVETLQVQLDHLQTRLVD